MKGEEEIRAHLDALRLAIEAPRGTTRVSEAMMRATANALAWLLEENPSYDEVVRDLARRNGQ